MKHLSENTKWRAKWLGGILILLAIWFGYNYHLKEVSCLKSITYNLFQKNEYSLYTKSGSFSLADYKNFKTQDEAMNYCMKVSED